MADEAEKPKQHFSVQRVYVKDLSLESPSAPLVFTKQWKPSVKVDLNTRSKHLGESNHEVVLTVTVNATMDEETVLLIEVQQAGLFQIEGYEGDSLRQILGIACPNLLFPYAREAVDATALKGGFPAIGLQPVNFEALYRQAQQEQQKAKEEAGESTSH